MNEYLIERHIIDLENAYIHESSHEIQILGRAFNDLNIFA